jgi:hypothetical protein
MLLKLLALPVTLPAAGIKFCLQQVLNAAEAELNDEASTREALLLLSLKLEEGEISEEEFVAQEAALVQRLREIRARKEQQLAAQGRAGPSPGGSGVAIGPGTRAQVVLEVAPEVPGAAVGQAAAAPASATDPGTA